MKIYESDKALGGRGRNNPFAGDINRHTRAFMYACVRESWTSRYVKKSRAHGDERSDFNAPDKENRLNQ